MNLRQLQRRLLALATILAAVTVASTCGTDTTGPAPAIKLAFTVQPSAVVAGAAITPAVQVVVQDAQGNTVSSTASITVAIGANPSSGALSGTSSVVASGGTASFSTLALEKAGVGYTLTATATGLTSTTSSAFTVSAGTATKLAFTVQPNAATAGLAITPAVQVTVQDALGNTATSSTANVTVAITSGTGTTGAVLGGTLTQAAANGVATFAELTLDKVGTGYTLTATATSLTSAASAAFNVTPGAATKLLITVQPSTATAGAAISPAVQATVQDAQGNAVTSATTSVTLAITSGTGTTGAVLGGTLTQAAINGVATFANLTVDKAGTSYTLTAAATGLTSATSSAFAVSPGAAAKLAFTVQPSNVVAGVAISPAIRVAVQDAQGNTVTNSGVNIALAISSGTGTTNAVLGGSATQAAVNGVATFANLTIDKASSGYSLTATTSSLASGTSGTFTVAHGTTARLAFSVQPSTVVAGVVISPDVQVTVQDTLRNTITNSALSISLAITSGTGTTGATLAGTVTHSAVNGVATFSNLTIDKAGLGYTLTAWPTTWNLNTTTTSASFSVVSGAATKLAFRVQPSAVVAGAAITPAVQLVVQDAQGNTVTTSTASVTLAITSGTGTTGAALGGTLTQAAVSGVATFANLTLDKAGSGYTLTATSASLASAISSAVQVISLMQSTSVVTGSVHSCELTTGGTVYCWGSNYDGQLGDGTLTDHLTPRAVSGGQVFQSISAGASHTCGLPAGGAAYCWGWNLYGQLGDGTTSDRSSPVAVAGGLAFQAISGGAGHTCGLTTGGAVYCWGANGAGQLGDGTTSNRNIPVAVSGGLVFQAISAGLDHTCGLAAGGTAYCWGYNGSGNLGDGTNSNRSRPVAVSGGLTFQSISGGGDHTCGLTATGAAYCWGDNSTGDLGNGTSSYVPVTSPVAVSGGLTFQSINGGNLHTCGITTGGAAYCWGYNAYGRLGDGTGLIVGNRTSPAAVLGSLTFKDISAGEQHTCGLTTGGAPYCWGFNAFGQLGDNTTTNRSTPVAVLNP